MQTQVSDPSGKWFCNQSAFPFFDPESGTRFEPQMPTKAKATDWLKNMPMIKAIAAPDEQGEITFPELDTPVDTPVAAAPAVENNVPLPKGKK